MTLRQGNGEGRGSSTRYEVRSEGVRHNGVAQGSREEAKPEQARGINQSTREDEAPFKYAEHLKPAWELAWQRFSKILLGQV